MNIRKWLSFVLVAVMLSTACVASAATFTPGEYEASAQGFGGTITVKVTVDEETITAIEIDGSGETPGAGRCCHRAVHRGVRRQGGCRCRG